MLLADYILKYEAVELKRMQALVRPLLSFQGFAFRVKISIYLCMSFLCDSFGLQIRLSLNIHP